MKKIISKNKDYHNYLFIIIGINLRSVFNDTSILFVIAIKAMTCMACCIPDLNVFF